MLVLKRLLSITILSLGFWTMSLIPCFHMIRPAFALPFSFFSFESMLQMNIKVTFENSFYSQQNQKNVSTECLEGMKKSQTQDYEGAIEQYTKCLVIDLDLLKAYVGRAFARTELGEYQKALEDYQKATNINSNYVDIYLGQAE